MPAGRYGEQRESGLELIVLIVGVVCLAALALIFLAALVARFIAPRLTPAS